METINTTKGQLMVPTDWESGLQRCVFLDGGAPVGVEKKTISAEDDKEFSVATEYWLDGELIHRSAHVILKPVEAASDVGRF